MTNINNVVIEGRLVKDAAEGYKRSGEVAYGSFSIAVSRSRKDKDTGKWDDEVSFVECKGFGKRYDYAVPRMTKGTTVRLIGRLVQDRWVSKDGQNKSKLIVEASEFFVDYKPRDDGQPQGYSPDEFWNAKPEGGSQESVGSFKEDIPF